jgi:hypothetical protein
VLWNIFTPEVSGAQWTVCRTLFFVQVICCRLVCNGGAMGRSFSTDGVERSIQDFVGEVA